MLRRPAYYIIATIDGEKYRACADHYAGARDIFDGYSYHKPSFLVLVENSLVAGIRPASLILERY